MTVIRQIPVPPAALQTLTGQNAAPAAGAVPLPTTDALQSFLADQKATLFTVLQRALGEAAPQQNGLAPLMADAEAMLGQNASSLPPDLKAALQNLLATRLTGQGGVDAGKLQEAVKQSGLFLESGLAKGQPVQGDLKAALLGLRQALQAWLGPRAAAAARSVMMPVASAAASQTPALPPAAQTGTTPPQTPSPLPTLPQVGLPRTPSTPMRDAALRLLAETEAMIERPLAQPVSTTTTPLKANLEAMLARADVPLPQAVREAIQTVLGQRPSPPVAGDAQKQNVLQQVPLPAGAANPQAASDLKSAMLGLRQALQNWLTPKTELPMPQLPQSAPTVPASAAVPPPLRGGPTVPQPPAQPLPFDAMPLQQAGIRLLAETDAALARHTMLQIASLPDDPAAPRSADNAQRLVLDIPLVTPQGTAIVQLRIEREQKRNAKGKPSQVWQAMFSVDTEPLGPVHARIAMVGETANVSLFAERSESASALRDNIPLLAAGLAEAAVEPGDILCATGAPAAPAAVPGLFVDRAS